MKRSRRCSLPQVVDFSFLFTMKSCPATVANPGNFISPVLSSQGSAKLRQVPCLSFSAERADSVREGARRLSSANCVTRPNGMTRDGPAPGSHSGRRCHTHEEGDLQCFGTG